MVQTTNPISELVTPIEIPTIESKAEIKTTSDSKIEIKKSLKVMQRPVRLFILFAHQIYHSFIIHEMFYFF